VPSSSFRAHGAPDRSACLDVYWHLSRSAQAGVVMACVGRMRAGCAGVKIGEDDSSTVENG
jgi:hypothetical protein